MARGIYRYDYIVLYKRSLDPVGYAPYTDFINRAAAANKTTVFDAAGTLTVSHNNSGLMISIVISSIALVSILGAALMIKRRKEDR